MTENIRTGLYVELLDFARQETLKLCATVPPEKHLFQLREGKATPLWLLGHLANTVNTIGLRWMLNQESLVSKELGLVFAPDFAGGTPPSNDASLYPSWEEVVQLYDRVMTQTVAGARTMADSELPDPVHEKLPERLIALFPNKGVAFMRLASHDAYHRGQIGLLSKI